MKQIIGLTGPTGSGKSTLKKVAEKCGAVFIDCDKIVHRVYQTDGDCIRAVAAAFGEETVENGVINRKVLAQKAFENQETIHLLNQTVFPFVTLQILKEIEAAESHLVVLDAPTLFESGIDELCGATIAVLANREYRRQRIIERDELDAAAAKLRLSGEKSDEFFLGKTKNIIYNNTDKETFEKAFEKFLKDFTGGNENE